MDTYTFKFTCPECGEEFTEEVELDNMEEASSYDKDNGMGVEIQHDFTVTVTCHECNTEFEKKGEVWEYPADVFQTPFLTN
ncbi:hypothetical protein EVJ24_14985 [Exiguobacterium sp. SH1S21]|uniref:hypothetical protein n=1 Tax=Exiguobacterium sp. SH1S21 TaxID=2510953 RepID=UPI00103CC063|nr:hypothetical protein [Exiguobacterium sp. SH1S21]TCI50311.1 hypothetical protein EVJ24_14985 [Exiguobacterium sp. SH1S21]